MSYQGTSTNQQHPFPGGLGLNSVGLSFEPYPFVPKGLRMADASCGPQPLCYLNVPVLNFQSLNVCLANLCIKFSVKSTSVICSFPKVPLLIPRCDGIWFCDNNPS